MEDATVIEISVESFSLSESGREKTKFIGGDPSILSDRIINKKNKKRWKSPMS